MTAGPSDQGQRSASLDFVTVVLAAGSGLRFGGAKQLAPVAGRPLITWAVDAALASGLERVVVVLGHQGDEVAGVLPSSQRLEIIRNPHHEQGMGASLALAARWCLANKSEVMAVLLGDQPLVQAETISQVARAAQASPSGAAAASIDGRRTHPIAFSRKHFAELADLSGDQGGRALLDRLGDALSLVPADPASGLDVDHPQDLAQVQELLSRSSEQS